MAGEKEGARGDVNFPICIECGYHVTSTMHRYEYHIRGSGLIYFVQQDVTLAVKIGYTDDLETLKRRVKSLRTSSPYRLRLVHLWEGDIYRERALHRHFAAYRLRGEWFRPCEAIADFIGHCKEWQDRHEAMLAAVLADVKA